MTIGSEPSIGTVTAENHLRKKITREAALIIVLLFVGFVLIPIAIYLVGQAIFGEYGGRGFGDFFGALAAKIRAGDRVAWFLVLSPNLVVFVLRLTLWGWRATARAEA